MTPSPQAQIRFLALGDSYTIGEGVEESGRWTEQLVSLLDADGIDLARPQTIATTGWTTDELAAAIQQAAPQGEFGLVTLLIGVNNQYRGRALDNYGEEFAALLAQAVGFAGDDPSRVVVLSIPDWGATPFGAASGRDLAEVSAQLDAYNRIARGQVEAVGAAWVDITPLSRRHGAEAAMVAADGLHPSARMYQEWALAAWPVLRARLTR